MAAAYNRGPAYLLSPEVCSVLASHVLAHLSAPDLARLACTCKELQAVVLCLSARVWRLAAADLLGSLHPALPGASTRDVCEALRQQVVARHNLLTGRCQERALHVPVGRMKLAPKGLTLAAWGWEGPGHWCSLRDLSSEDSEPLALNFGGGSIRDLTWASDSASVVVLCVTGQAFEWCRVDRQTQAKVVVMQLDRRWDSHACSLSPHGNFLIIPAWHSQHLPLELSVVGPDGQQVAVSHNHIHPTCAHYAFRWHAHAEGTLALLESCASGSRVSVEDVHTLQTLAQGPLHSARLILLALQPVCGLVAYLCLPPCDMPVIWHLSSSTPWMQIAIAMPPSKHQVSLSVQGLAAINTGREVCVWQPRTGEKLFSVDVSKSTPLSPDDPLRSFDIVPIWAPNGRLLALIAPWPKQPARFDDEEELQVLSSKVSIWNACTRSMLHELCYPNKNIVKLVWHASCNRIVLCLSQEYAYGIYCGPGVICIDFV